MLLIPLLILELIIPSNSFLSPSLIKLRNVNLKANNNNIIQFNNTSEYLNNLNITELPRYKYNDDNNINKLENVKNKIDKYIKGNNFKLEKGHLSNYNPIKKVAFDSIFLNIYNIEVIYMSNNGDRIIFEYKNKNRVVFYINNKDDLNKINQLIKIIPNNIKFKIICDIPNVMDDMFGYLYCEKNNISNTE